MDTTVLTQTVADDQNAVTSAQSALDAANAKLKADTAELANATFINQIEALENDADLLAIVQAALTADNSKVSVSVTP